MATVVTVVTGLIAVPLTAQEVAARPAAQDSSPKQRAATDGEVGQRDAQHRDHGTAHAFMRQESRHRMWNARLSRMRQIAEAQGDEERLARLDKVEARINALRARSVAMARERMGDERFEQMVDQMKQRDVRRTAQRRHHRHDMPEQFRDHRQGVRDRREDVRDRREDVRDRREDGRDRREDARERRDSHGVNKDRHQQRGDARPQQSGHGGRSGAAPGGRR